MGQEGGEECSWQREERGEGQEARGALPTTGEQGSLSGCTQSVGWGDQCAHCIDEKTEALREEVTCQIAQPGDSTAV